MTSGGGVIFTEFGGCLVAERLCWTGMARVRMVGKVRGQERGVGVDDIHPCSPKRFSVVYA